MSDRLGDDAFATYLEFEAKASVIRNYQPAVVPGLLQTYAYASALLAPYTGAEERLKRRMDRQGLVLTERLGAGQVRCEFIVQEVGLRRPVGDDVVMARQYQHLEGMSRLEGVSLKVIPMAVGPHRGLAGAFSLLTVPGMTAVYTEGLWTDTFALGDGAGNWGEQLWAELAALAQPFNHLPEGTLAR